MVYAPVSKTGVLKVQVFPGALNNKGTNMKDFPKYISLGNGGTVLSLDCVEDDKADYYSPAGNWSVDVRWVCDKLVTECFDYDHLNNIKCFEVSESEFKKDNYGYV